MGGKAQTTIKKPENTKMANTPTQRTPVQQPGNVPSGYLLYLQRVVGNQGVEKLIQANLREQTTGHREGHSQNPAPNSTHPQNQAPEPVQVVKTSPIQIARQTPPPTPTEPQLGPARYTIEEIPLNNGSVQIHVTGYVGDSITRPGLEKKYPEGSKVGLSGYDRYHVAGPYAIGAEEGIVYAPENFNLSKTKVIENTINKARTEILKMGGGDVLFDFTAVVHKWCDYEGVEIRVLDQITWEVDVRVAGSDKVITIINETATLPAPPGVPPAATPKTAPAKPKQPKKKAKASKAPAKATPEVAPEKPPVTTGPAQPSVPDTKAPVKAIPEIGAEAPPAATGIAGQGVPDTKGPAKIAPEIEAEIPPALSGTPEPKVPAKKAPAAELGPVEVLPQGGRRFFNARTMGNIGVVGAGLLAGILEGMVWAKIEGDSAQKAAVDLQTNIQQQLRSIDKRILAAVQINKPGGKLYAHVSYTLLEHQATGQPGDPFNGPVDLPIQTSVESVKVTGIDHTYSEEKTSYRHDGGFFYIDSYTTVSYSIELPLLSPEELQEFAPQTKYVTGDSAQAFLLDSFPTVINIPKTEVSVLTETAGWSQVVVLSGPYEGKLLKISTALLIKQPH